MKTFKETLEPYPQELKDEYAIADYIEELDSSANADAFRDGNFGKHIKAVLKTIKINDLKEGDGDHNQPSKQKQTRIEMKSKNGKPFPPILVDGKTVIDGNHRFRFAKKRGDKDILAYVIE
jgi:hypothetical protein